MTHPVVTRNGVAVGEAVIAEFESALHGGLLRPDRASHLFSALGRLAARGRAEAVTDGR